MHFFEKEMCKEKIKDGHSSCWSEIHLRSTEVIMDESMFEFDEEPQNKISDIIDSVARIKTNDWLETGVQLGTTASELEECIAICPRNERCTLRRVLRRYLREIENFVDAILVDHQYIDKKTQIKVFWESPVLPRGSLVYKPSNKNHHA